MKKDMRFLTFFLCLFIVLTMLLSASAISHNTDHTCVGEGCRVCLFVQNVIDALKLFSLAAVIYSFSLSCIYIFFRSIMFGEGRERQLTPVVLKVKLSN